nr:immunoglobulin light chain junction region [Macaca mulatta]MOW05099.1 immunoglobulin light chain junction region [Macaca mulatta]
HYYCGTWDNSLSAGLF